MKRRIGKRVSLLLSIWLLLFLLTGVGFLRPGTYAQGFFATHSRVIYTFASWADSFAADRPQEGDGG